MARVFHFYSFLPPHNSCFVLKNLLLLFFLRVGWVQSLAMHLCPGIIHIWNIILDYAGSSKHKSEHFQSNSFFHFLIDFSCKFIVVTFMFTTYSEVVWISNRISTFISALIANSSSSFGSLWTRSLISIVLADFCTLISKTFLTPPIFLRVVVGSSELDLIHSPYLCCPMLVVLPCLMMCWGKLWL